MTIETLEETEVIDLSTVIPYADDGDKKRLTHIINPPLNVHIWRPGMDAQDVVDIARVQGLEVVALCGYKWVPLHDPEKYPICQQCMNIAGHLMREAGE